MVTEHLTRKADGTWWRVIYGYGTIQWVPTSGAGGDAEDDRSTPPGLSPVMGGGPFQAIMSTAHAASEVGQWWELRQQRLAAEAAHEQSQRIEWLSEMMGRWAEIHHGGNQLDLRVSEYLAREARGFIDVVASNKRIALPQSLLYELDLIQDSFRAVRQTLSSQFKALTDSDEVHLKEAIRQVLPGRSLDMAFIDRLAKDPGTVWAEKVRGKSSAGFDEEFAQAFRFPDVFRDHLFPSTEVGIPEAAEPAQKGFAERIVNLVADGLPWPRWEDVKADLPEKRDAFRELLLLPAEFVRIRALHSAWRATAAVVSEAHGEDLAVLLGSEGIAVTLEPRNHESSAVAAINSRHEALTIEPGERA